MEGPEEDEVWLRFDFVSHEERSVPRSDVPEGRTYRIDLGGVGSLRERELEANLRVPDRLR